MIEGVSGEERQLGGGGWVEEVDWGEAGHPLLQTISTGLGGARKKC